MRNVLRSAMLGLALLAVPSVAHAKSRPLDQIKHFVVIYEENHSFDNLYAGWEGVDGLQNGASAAQVDQFGRAYKCLPQNDVNLTAPPLSASCTGEAFTSHFPNAPFRIDDFIAPTDKTCPEPGVFAANGVAKGAGKPGGCTRDLVHRFYQERYQIHGGRMDRYVNGSDAIGLVMGQYDTRKLPIYKYLHGRRHPDYAILDRFFQAAFGGSFLNHQWLVAAATPVFPGAPADQHSIVDANGMPTAYPQYVPTAPVRDTALTQACPIGAGLACGDFAVNTIQPAFQPYAPGTPDARRLPPQTAPTIGDRLSAKKLDWAWYSGGWSNAAGNVGAPGWTNGTGPACSDPKTVTNATYPYCPDKLFQFHHQPLNYFMTFAPGTHERGAHLRDETEFIQKARASRRTCALKRVSFVKPIGAENEHPGYASEHAGSNHLVSLLRLIQRSRCARDTMVVVTYDEFGGQWDHVPPPGFGTRGVSDVMGPGTRIPALVLAPGLREDFVVDHVSHDTTSIMATIEERFGLAPLTSRDRKVRDLSSVFSARPRN